MRFEVALTDRTFTKRRTHRIGKLWNHWLPGLCPGRRLRSITTLGKRKARKNNETGGRERRSKSKEEDRERRRQRALKQRKVLSYGLIISGAVHSHAIWQNIMIIIQWQSCLQRRNCRWLRTMMRMMTVRCISCSGWHRRHCVMASGQVAVFERRLSWNAQRWPDTDQQVAAHSRRRIRLCRTTDVRTQLQPDNCNRAV